MTSKCNTYNNKHITDYDEYISDRNFDTENKANHIIIVRMT